MTARKRDPDHDKPEEVPGVRMYDLGESWNGTIRSRATVCVDLHDRTGNAYVLERFESGPTVRTTLERGEVGSWLALYLGERAVEAVRELEQTIEHLTRKLGHRRRRRRGLKRERWGRP